MSFIFGDGFDYFNRDVGDKWDTTVGNPTPAAGRRTGGGAWQGYIGGLGIERRRNFADQTDVIAQFAWYVRENSVSGLGGRPISFWGNPTGGQRAVHIEINANGSITLKNGGATLATSSPALLAADSWYYFELLFRHHPSTGRVRLRLEGLVDVFDLQDINTTAGALSAVDNINGVEIRNGKHDDFLLFNTTDSGDGFHEFIGDQCITTLLPNLPGAQQQWTKVGGGTPDNFSAVNEENPDGDTSYVHSVTPGQLDWLQFPNVASNSQDIKGVMMNVLARKDDAQARQIRLGIKKNASTAMGGNHSIQDNYRNKQSFFAVNPATGLPWQVADFPIEGGYEFML